MSGTDDAPAPGGAIPKAVVVEQQAREPEHGVWIRRGVFLLLLVLGWAFILWQNKLRLTPPAAFVCLGYLAILATVYTLWRTGVVVVTPEGDEEELDSTWGRPLGERGELEREKRALLKAIKEAEFDREMGKLSPADADDMIRLYRARAIETIKELDRLEHNLAGGTVRDQIEREVRARLELEGKAKRTAAEGAAATKQDKGKGKAARRDAAAPAAPAAAAAAAPADDTAAEGVAAASAGDAPAELPTPGADDTASSEQAKEASP